MLDRYARLAVALLQVPLAQLNVVTTDRQFTKSSFGPASERFSREVPLTHSYCQYVMSDGEPLWISDARGHPLVGDNGATSEGGIVAYGGVPIRVEDHAPPIATLCAVDFAPRRWNSAERAALEDLAAVLAAEIRLRLEMEKRTQVERALRVSRIRERELNRELEDRIIHRTAELEAANEQLRQAQKMEAIGRLASGVAHDFNNVLTVIRGNCAIALDGPSADGSTTEALREINDAVEHASSLTAQLLALSRQAEARPEEISLARFVGRIQRMVEHTVRPRAVQVRTESAERGEWAVVVDPNRLTQVVLNLAANARDAMDEEGVLTLSVEQLQIERPRRAGFIHEVPPGRYGRLAVADTGTGMTAEQLEHALEPFYTTKSNGTGLGLSTSYGIIKQAGGFLGIHSSPGAGTTVEILLPIVRPA